MYNHVDATAPVKTIRCSYNNVSSLTGYIWNCPKHITFPGGATLNFNYNGLQ